jgi:hypothetical protein
MRANASDDESSKHQRTEPQPRSLTEAQLEFAKILGRLLANRWEEEQRGKRKPVGSGRRPYPCTMDVNTTGGAES